MIKRKTWEEFRSTGLLWFINQTLHVFGWAIVVEMDKDGKLTDAYPARVKFRGFNEQSQEKGYINISEYMNKNSEELLKEAKE